jgi:MFS family permease
MNAPKRSTPVFPAAPDGAARLRRLHLFEQGWPWAFLAIVAGFVMTVLVMLVASGALPDPWGRAARGYTLTGTTIGVFVVVLCLVAFFYSLRKRALQEKLPAAGSMMTWLWVHVAVGVLAFGGALLHAGLGAVSPYFSSGKLLLIVMAAMTISGVVWRVVYGTLPAKAQPHIGNYAQAASMRHADDRLVAIEAIAAGRDDRFRQLTAWLLENDVEAAALAAAAPDLGPADRGDLERIRQLAQSRRRALRRHGLQARYVRLLQGWRYLHVPMALALVPLLVAHVIGATRTVERALRGSAPSQRWSGVAPSTDCKGCHTRIYKDWQRSMHAHAMKSPVMIVQNNRVFREELGDEDAPDPKLLCVNCHGPLGVLLTQGEQAKLPFRRTFYDDALLNEGISCVTCHQILQPPEEGAVGLAAFQDDLAPPDGTYYGPFKTPVPNAVHKSAYNSTYARSERMCVGCHNVIYDRDKDGLIEVGTDLILQRTTAEYDAYREQGGKGTCIDCHMPLLEDVDDSAERALDFFERDADPPRRDVHDHAFVGVDYPLDGIDKSDPQRPAREALLQRAARLEARLVPGGTLEVAITNSGSGHNMPTGLAFARQLWLEVKAFDDKGTLVFSSGVLAKPSDDLCDDDTLREAEMKPFVVGCAAADPQLVNFQQKLLDDIDTERDRDGQLRVVAGRNAKESVLQRLRGGVVARRRPIDGQLQDPIAPETIRSYTYSLPPETRAVTVRLLFRIFPPYFLRALASGAKKGEPDLAALAQNLLVSEMVQSSAR